jgi:hypothetical protein
MEKPFRDFVTKVLLFCRWWVKSPCTPGFQVKTAEISGCSSPNKMYRYWSMAIWPSSHHIYPSAPDDRIAPQKPPARSMYTNNVPRMVSWEWEQMCNPVLGQFMAFFVGPSYPVSFWPNKGSVHIFSTETQKPPKTAIRIRVIGPFAAVLWQHDCPLRSRHRPRWRPPCSFNVLRLLFGDFIIDPKISAFLVLKSFDAFYLHVVHAFPSSLPKKMLSYEILPKCLGNQLIMEHPENLRNIRIDSPKRQRI